MSVKSITLYYSDIATGGTSDKVWSLHVLQKGSGYVVAYQNGRRGGTMTGKDLTPEPVSLEEAGKIFNTRVNQKLREGYVPPKDGVVTLAPVQASVATASATRTPYPIEELEEVEYEDEATLFLHDDRYWLQKKNNGEFRQIQKLEDGTFIGYNKLGLIVNSLPAEVVADLKQVKAKTFFMAGELVGNRWIGENLLELNGKNVGKLSYAKRFTMLESLILAKARHLTITATWKTLDEKLQGRKALERTRAEGEVYKLISATYHAGASRQHKKFKYVKTLSAIVIGKGFKGHNSATLGLYDHGKMIEVGRASLNGKQDVVIGSVVEVRYLYGTEGRRLYQPRLPKGKKAIRTDVDPKKCTVDQIIYHENVA